MAIVALAFGCSSSRDVEPLRGSARERRLVLGGKGVRVAEAKGPDAEMLGVEWLEARVRSLSSSVDRKGVATSSRRSGIAMDYVAHGADGDPVIAGALALDFGSIARLPLEPTTGQLVSALAPDQHAVRVSRRGREPSPPLSYAERAATIRLVLDSFAGGGKSAEEAKARPARATTSTKSVDVVVSGTIRPCAEAGERDVPCVDGHAAPDGCFGEVCDIEDFEVMKLFTDAAKDAIQDAHQQLSCVEFLTVAGLALADLFIVVDGPAELLLTGAATALARRCMQDILADFIETMVTEGLLIPIKNYLCATRDARLPEIKPEEVDLPSRLLIDLVNRVGGTTVGGDIDHEDFGAYVADVFNTVRACTCGYASAAAGQVPVRAQRVVDAEGRIACLPCAEGSHYDPDELACVPDEEDAVITICTEGGDQAMTTPCGEPAPEVRVIEPELCLDVWVTEYTGEQAANGTIPPPRMETVRIRAEGAPFTVNAPISFEPSFDQCAPAGFSGSRLEEAWNHPENDDLTYGIVITHKEGDGTGLYSAVLSPFPGPDGQRSYFPGHACAQDESGTTHCIDSVPVDYLAGSPTHTPYAGAAPGFYWCDYQGSKCRDALTGGRGVPPATSFPSYYPRGYGKDTCANPVSRDDVLKDPPSRDVLQDTCEGKADGVHCSVAPDNRGGGYRCKAGKMVAEVRCQGDLVCVETPNVDQIQCESPLSKTDCGDKPDGWWCLDSPDGVGWMAYCAGQQIAGGCACASCTKSGVRAACSAAPPPAACPL